MPNVASRTTEEMAEAATCFQPFTKTCRENTMTAVNNHTINRRSVLQLEASKTLSIMLYPASGDQMKETLKIGIRYEHKFVVPPSKMVPALYPEAEEFVAMPEVFATGFLVGFLEWACIKAINPHLDWPKEQTVGTHIAVSHQAATPAGLQVTATVELIAIEGRKLVFAVEAHDGLDLISTGLHERFIINKERFMARVSEKRSTLS